MRSDMTSEARTSGQPRPGRGSRAAGAATGGGRAVYARCIDVGITGVLSGPIAVAVGTSAEDECRAAGLDDDIRQGGPPVSDAQDVAYVRLLAWPSHSRAAIRPDLARGSAASGCALARGWVPPTGRLVPARRDDRADDEDGRPGPPAAACAHIAAVSLGPVVRTGRPRHRDRCTWNHPSGDGFVTCRCATRFSLAGKAALITGASSGPGGSLPGRRAAPPGVLANAVAYVVLAARRTDRLGRGLPGGRPGQLGAVRWAPV